MPREPKPYVKDGWYCTSMGGMQHQKLCRIEEGVATAKDKLAYLRGKRYEARVTGQAAPSPGQGVVPLIVAPNQLTPTAPSVTQVVDDFLDYQQAETSGPTFGWYKEKLLPFYERFGDRPITSLTYEDGIKYKTWLRTEKTWRRGKGDVRKGLGPTTVNHHIRTARIALAWAFKPSRRHKYGLTMNPFEEIGLFTEKPRERLITDEEFHHLLANCSDGNTAGAAQDMRDTLRVLRNTTMRPGELRLLKWDYVHWDKHRIVFPATVVKTRKRREVVMLDAVKDILLARRTRFEAMGKSPTGYIFPLPGKDAAGKKRAGLSNEPQQAGHFAQKFRRLVERCVRKGLMEREKAGERIVPYSTRHTRITEQFVQGNDHAVVMHDAGHTNPITTERYKHLAGSHVAEAITRRSQPAGRSDDSAGGT